MKSNQHIFGIVLAGGSGNRLWPLSTKKNPKYLLSLDSKISLLESTLVRISTLTNKLYIVTCQEHEEIIKRKLFSLRDLRYIVEPYARNTAAAIFLATLEISRDNPDAILFFVPADHNIPNNKLFCEYMRKALHAAAQHNSLVLLGLKPNYPATGYGYIECDKNLDTVFNVKKFHEKPSYQEANNYINQKMLWNSGIFCAPAALLINLYKKYAPEIVTALQEYNMTNNPEKYQALQAISFDYAILEKCESLVIPADFEWSDVGTVDAFLKAACYKQATVTIDGNNNRAFAPGKLVTFVGLENICLIETEDTILVMQESESEDIKKLITQLQKQDYERYL